MKITGKVINLFELIKTTLLGVNEMKNLIGQCIKSKKINDKSLHIITKKGKKIYKKARKIFRFF